MLVLLLPLLYAKVVKFDRITFFSSQGMVTTAEYLIRPGLINCKIPGRVSNRITNRDNC